MVGRNAHEPPVLKYALSAIGLAAVLAVAFVVLSTGGGGPRPETRILSPGDTSPPNGFVIHDAPPPPPVPAPSPPPPTGVAQVQPGQTPAPSGGGDLDAVMQRLRQAAGKPDDATPPPAPVPGPSPAPATLPAPQAAAPPPGLDVPAAPPPIRWTSVTGQGTRWRMVRAGNGFTLSIDLGNGGVADVHVLPAFANLDPAAVKARVDYLKRTILQDFSGSAGSYTFARDGSVSVSQ